MNSFFVLIFFISSVFLHHHQAVANQRSQNVPAMYRRASINNRQSIATMPSFNMRLYRLKKALQRGFIRKISICYKRFQHCSSQLSASFCASSTRNLTFYIWARKVADKIMNGFADGHSSIKCYPEQVLAMAKALNIVGKTERQAMFHLWTSIGKRLNKSIM